MGRRAFGPAALFLGAELLAAWLVSPEGQKAIGGYGKDEYGQALFAADASSLRTVSQGDLPSPPVVTGRSFAGSGGFPGVS